MSVPEFLRRRASGILLHPTSLPTHHGIGDLGPAARQFAERLVDAHQSWWQMLPIGPTGAGNSPYHGLSAFAGNPLLISLDDLVEDGLLDAREVETLPIENQWRVDFGQVIPFKERHLRSAFSNFCLRGPTELVREYRDFKDANADAWLDDYALFAALRIRLEYRGLPEWPVELRTRQADSLARARGQLSDEIAYHSFVQYLFDRQWRRFGAHAKSLGLLLLGDVPIFVAPDSADVWAHPEIFLLDDQGLRTVVAGVPPDYFSEDGQLWGNPLYDWDRLRADGFGWWNDRFRALLARFDAARVDHFIGFYRAWQIPPDAENAKVGEFVPGPRDEFFQSLDKALGGLPIVAEDLGLLTDEVRALRDRFGLPGLKVLQFAFTPDGEETENQPHTYPENCVVYTGTHDNDTTVGWWQALEAASASEDEETAKPARGTMASVLEYLKTTDDQDMHWKMIELAMGSVANLSLFPAQDLLGLGSEHRMNTPGTAEHNWEWRLREDALTSQILDYLRQVTDHAHRWPEE